MSERTLWLAAVSMLLGAIAALIFALWKRDRSLSAARIEIETYRTLLEIARNEFRFALRKPTKNESEPEFRIAVLDQRAPEKILFLRDPASSQGLVAVARIEDGAIVLRSPISTHILEGSAR